MTKSSRGVKKLILLLGDLFIIAAAAYIAIGIVISYSGSEVEIEVYNKMFPVMVIVLGILFNVHGLFSLQQKKFSEIFISLGAAMFNMWIIMMAISFFLREFAYSRSILIVAIIMQVFLLTVWRYLFWRVENAFVAVRDVLVVGSGPQCERIIISLQAQPHLRYNVKYVCNSCGEIEWGKMAENVDLVILCSDVESAGKAKTVQFCHVNSKQVFIIPEFYELFCSNVSLDKIDDIPVFCPNDFRPTQEQFFLKRILDISFSLGVLLCLSPIFLCIALAVKLDSPGPVFYSQIRSGRYEKLFNIYKFRSMFQNSEQHTGPVLATEDDQRITRVGRFLRASRFDEVPQFINVLKGDMSIVGPRPERPFFVEKYKEEISEYAYRHNVKPGITGMAQVWGKYTTAAQDKLIYDLLYVQHCNVITDLVIMLQTLQVLASKASSKGVIKAVSRIDLTKYKI